MAPTQHNEIGYMFIYVSLLTFGKQWGYYISTSSSNVLKVSDFNQEMFYCFVYNAMKLFNKQNKSILPGEYERTTKSIININTPNRNICRNISQFNWNMELCSTNNKLCFKDMFYVLK